MPWFFEGTALVGIQHLKLLLHINLRALEIPGSVSTQVVMLRLGFLCYFSVMLLHLFKIMDFFGKGILTLLISTSQGKQEIRALHFH
jgi:hypothetical protein